MVSSQNSPETIAVTCINKRYFETKNGIQSIALGNMLCPLLFHLIHLQPVLYQCLLSSPEQLKSSSTAARYSSWQMHLNWYIYEWTQAAPCGRALRSFPIFCHGKQSRGARPSPQAILHMWGETCRVNFQKWNSWIKGCAKFIFWLLLQAWSLWRLRWSRVYWQGVWGRACPGPIQGAVSTIGACVKQGHKRISKSKTCFIHVGILQRQVPGQRNSFESPLSLVQTAEPGSRVTCGWPSIICFHVHPPKPGLWNKVLGACHLLVQNGLIPSCWQEKDSKWIFAFVVLNNWRPTSWRSRWGGKKQETGERWVQMSPLCPGP